MRPSTALRRRPWALPWHSDLVSERNHGPEAALGSLVGAWLDWAATADALGVSVSKVRQLVRDHQLAAAEPEPGTGPRVPAGLIAGGAVVKGVPGVLTVLHDGGYADREIIAWLYTPDDSLPGRPVDALRENRGTEVRRRAQAMAF
jgi:hypothetical protein